MFHRINGSNQQSSRFFHWLCPIFALYKSFSIEIGQRYQQCQDSFLPAPCKGIHSRLTLEYSQLLCILHSLRDWSKCAVSDLLGQISVTLWGYTFYWLWLLYLCYLSHDDCTRHIYIYIGCCREQIVNQMSNNIYLLVKV